MPTFEYPGIAYRQALDPESPWLVTFVTSADELLKWAGVPRRSEQNEAGFQRLVNPERVQQATEYFEQPMNQSPTALIVGLRSGSPGEPSARIKFLDDNHDASGGRPCTVCVDYEEQSLEEAVNTVRIQLESRLGPTISGDDAGAPFPDEELEPPTPTTENEVEDDEEGDDATDPEELELGHSVLRALLQRLDDPDWLAQAENASAVHDLAKPGTIIDGQHRVLGAKDCDRGIPFSIVALADCTWPEQVFQFTVVNYTQKGIPDAFITANAALSLTTAELDNLKVRLVQAKVKVIEYELMTVVNFDTSSPFYGLVNLTDKARSDLIGYRTMVQVARLWYDASHQVFTMLLPNLYPEIQGKGKKTKRVQRWREGDWGDFFLAFWKIVHEHFASEPSHDDDSTLWTVGESQLMLAVVLLEFEKAFLDNLNDQDEEYFVVPEGADRLSSMRLKIEQRAKKFVKFFPPEFFASKWGITSLNTGLGRRELSSCLEQHVKKKGKYQWENARLVTGNTSAE